VLRQDSGHAARQVGSTQRRSLPTGIFISTPRLLHCGDRTRLTYVITTGSRSQRVVFSVSRAPLPASAR
jgi:hypothetical protein